MQTDTGKTPSEWIAIHEEELGMLAVEGDLGAYDLPTIRAIESEAAAIRYWSFVRSRIRSGAQEPTDYEEEARRIWRRAVAAAERYGVNFGGAR